jgi:sec-independent protein translocase protein TatC
VIADAAKQGMPLEDAELEPRGQMSFLEHLDELRRRIVNVFIFIVLAFILCWFVSDYIYNFLSAPIRRALSEAARRDVPEKGLTGDEKVEPLSELKAGDTGRYVFDRPTKIGTAVLSAGASVDAIVALDPEGKPGLFTNEPLYTTNSIIPKGVRLPIDFRENTAVASPSGDERLIVTTAFESFTLYMTVSLYAAIALTIPMLLWQIWGFISPGLYRHERAYVWPFVFLSTTSFVIGAAFAYYVLFPPAARYLLGLGSEFQLLLKASDFLDFITLIMLAMGIIFQMPAITYVLARIGLVTAGFLIRSWKISLVVILIVAAVVSPTNDIPNMLLFAAPMIGLYVISIFIAWIFAKRRQTDAEAAVSG